MEHVFRAKDGKQRCSWCSATPDYMHYHDKEWGMPVVDDRRLFEKLCLEGFQSGLSWLTILNKRDNFRRAFQNFDYHKLARFEQKDVARLLTDAGIIRHRGKIVAAINNAQKLTELIAKEGSFAAFIWRFEPDEKTLPPPQSVTTCKESVALAKALKKRGWQFVGPTTAYAFMQSMGLVNDHAEHCDFRAQVTKARRSLVRPSA